MKTITEIINESLKDSGITDSVNSETELYTVNYIQLQNYANNILKHYSDYVTYINTAFPEM